ncbi:MAG: hypothetical protein V2A77_04525 [Pseudomonadota bacterium]
MDRDKLFQNASWQLDDDEDDYADDDLNSPLFSPEMEAGFARARDILMEHLRERQAERQAGPTPPDTSGWGQASSLTGAGGGGLTASVFQGSRLQSEPRYRSLFDNDKDTAPGRPGIGTKDSGVPLKLAPWEPSDPKCWGQGQAQVHPAWRDTSVNSLFTKYDDDEEEDEGRDRYEVGYDASGVPLKLAPWEPSDPKCWGQGQAKVHPAWNDTSVNSLFTKYDDHEEDTPEFDQNRAGRHWGSSSLHSMFVDHSKQPKQGEERPTEGNPMAHLAEAGTSPEVLLSMGNWVMKQVAKRFGKKIAKWLDEGEIAYPEQQRQMERDTDGDGIVDFYDKNDDRKNDNAPNRTRSPRPGKH